MRFKAFTVTPGGFRQLGRASAARRRSAVASPPAPPAPAATSDRRAQARDGRQPRPRRRRAPRAPAGAGAGRARRGSSRIPRDKIPAYAVPQTPYPGGSTFDDNLLAKGDRGERREARCRRGRLPRLPRDPRQPDDGRQHRTEPHARRARGTTIAAGLYPNDPQHLARWIKNARVMKPGVIMPTLGMASTIPCTKTHDEGRPHRPADRRHRRVSADSEVTNRRTRRHRRMATAAVSPAYAHVRRVVAERDLELAHDRRPQADRRALPVHRPRLVRRSAASKR